MSAAAPRAGSRPPAGVVGNVFGLRPSGWTLVDGGEDPTATVWRATGCGPGDATDYAVKVGRRPVRVGAMVVAALAARRVAGVPIPVLGPTGSPTVEVDGGWIGVQHWTDGRAACDEPLSREQWAALGRLLRRVHDTPFDAVPAVVPEERYEHRRTADDFGRVDQAMRGPGEDDLSAEVGRVWRTAFPDGPELPDVADQLAPMQIVRGIVGPSGLLEVTRTARASYPALLQPLKQQR